MRRRQFVPILLVALISACGGDDAVSPEAGLIGTWSLQTEDGVPTTQAVTVVITATEVRVTVDGLNCTLIGSYTLVGDTVTTTTTGFTGAGCFGVVIGEVDAIQATVSGDTLTVNDGGVIQVYTRV